MAKVHPLDPPAAAADPSKRESFTVWMKSLVMHGNGFTVFNENGEIVYRLDNYDKKGCNEVYLMDLHGKVLYTIRRRSWFLGRYWEGYEGDASNSKKEKPSFQVSKKGHVALRSNGGQVQESWYKLQALAAGGKSELKMVDCRGGVVAEARRKQLSSGLLLGDDVLTLVVEPHVDQSLVMALVTVHGLMHHRL